MSFKGLLQLQQFYDDNYDDYMRSWQSICKDLQGLPIENMQMPHLLLFPRVKQYLSGCIPLLFSPDTPLAP